MAGFFHEFFFDAARNSSSGNNNNKKKTGKEFLTGKGGRGGKTSKKTTNCLHKLKFPPQKRQLWGRYLATKILLRNTKFEIMRACSSTQTPNLLILFAHHHIHTYTHTHIHIDLNTYIHMDIHIHTRIPTSYLHNKLASGLYFPMCRLLIGPETGYP